jgi:hypothetical protein
MAKVTGNNNKATFGKRKCGKYKKSKGPKEKNTKPYARQGR